MDFEALKAYLSRSVIELGSMNARLGHALLNEGMRLIAHIYARDPVQFLRTPNVGQKTYKELAGLLDAAGVPWGSMRFKEPQKIWNDRYEDGMRKVVSAGEDAIRSLMADDIILSDDVRAMDGDSLLLLQFIPEQTRNGLSQAFLVSVVNDPAVRTKVRAVMAEAVQSHLDRKGGPA